MKIFIIFGPLLLSIFLLNCNPAYEDVQGKICNSLHPLKPVPMLPRSKYCHGESFRFPYKACTEVQCHASRLTGGNSGAPSCYQCHGDLWTIFSTTHIFKIGGYYHDPRVDTQPDTSFPDCAVAACHGVTLQGVAGAGYSCRLCHDPIPPPGHRVNQEGARHHFNMCRTPHLAFCGTLACHGTDANLDNGTAPPCSNCHEASKTCD